MDARPAEACLARCPVIEARIERNLSEILGRTDELMHMSREAFASAHSDLRKLRALLRVRAWARDPGRPILRVWHGMITSRAGR